MGSGLATITVTTGDGQKTATSMVTVRARFAVTGVTLDQTNISIRVGDSGRLNATVLPDNAANKYVSWSSSDSRIVSVDRNGRYVGLRPGTATITVTTADGHKTAKCIITVTGKK